MTMDYPICTRPNVLTIEGECIYDDIRHPAGDGCGCLHPNGTGVCPYQCVAYDVLCPLEG